MKQAPESLQQQKRVFPAEPVERKNLEKMKMKKLFAVMMTLCLTFTAFAAFAAATEPTTVQWSAFEEEAAKVEGQFATINGVGLKMFIPAEFKDTELSEETMQSGTILVLKTEKEEKAVVNAQVLGTDIASFKDLVESKGSVCRPMIVNGIHCYQFSVNSDGIISTCFAFSAGDKVLVFSFSLADQEPYTSLYKLMAASIQTAE